MRVSGRTARFGLVSAVLARLCMLLSLWQAPVPWLHNHGTNASLALPVTAAREFDSHIIVYHPSIDRSVDREFGWHCHWVLPTWKHFLDDTPDDEPPVQEPIAFDPVDVSTVGELNACLPLLVVLSFVEPALQRTVSAASLPDHCDVITSFHPEGHSTFVLRC